MVVAFACLGLLAGVITTLTGQGGGLFLLLALSALVGPHRALALSTAALFVGNVHRFVAHRRKVVWPVATPLMITSLAGALLGGAFAARAPEWFLKSAIVSMTAIALVRRARGTKASTITRFGLWGGGLFVGVLTGTSGGAGFMLAPLTMSAGLTGEPYMATQSAAAVMIHLGRIVAYGASGMYAQRDTEVVVVLTVGILAGNVLAARARRYLSDEIVSRGEVVVLLACAIVSVIR